MANLDKTSKVGKSESILIDPPKKLKQKVRGTPGLPSAEVLKNIEQRIKAIANNYPEWALKDVQAILTLLEEVTPSEPNDKRLIDRIYPFALELKGQGGTFGFPKISEISKSLCLFIEGLRTVEDFDARARDICKAHAEVVLILLTNAADNSKSVKLDEAIFVGLYNAVQSYAAKHNITLPK